MIKFRAIKPVPLNEAAMNAVLKKQANTVGEMIVKDFDRVTTGWSGARPRWGHTVQSTTRSIFLRIHLLNYRALGGKKWEWLDLGTPPHRIEAKSGKTLAFPSQHQSGSAPGSLRTFPGKSGGETVFAKGVNHPGIKARGWSAMLRKSWERDFAIFMKAAFAEVARVSGHSMEGKIKW